MPTSNGTMDHEQTTVLCKHKHLFNEIVLKEAIVYCTKCGRKIFGKQHEFPHLSMEEIIEKYVNALDNVEPKSHK